MKHIKNKANALLKRATEKMIRHEVEGWPPDCVTFVYQPKRPRREDNVMNGVAHSDRSIDIEKF